MTFEEVLVQVTELLQHQGRISYGALKRRFGVDDAYLQDLKDELIGAQRVALDEGGKILVWAGAAQVASVHLSPPSPQPHDARPSEAERRQLTVMFCDLVDSTALSEKLDPEELRELVRAYQAACAEVIDRFAGSIAQYLGDGILTYFGYPTAHEDDAARAVHAGLEIVETLRLLNPRLPQPIQVRIGIHTGQVVVGEMGGGRKREQLALGETPNIAARVQGLAEPNTVILSAVTHRLVAGLFDCQDRGAQQLKGFSTPVSLYQVIGAGTARSRFEVAVGAGLTPLVGREEELGLLKRRWTQAKDGAGQVVLLSGEPGIGKSRLVQVLKEQLEHEDATRIEFRCSPYHQNSTFYPIIEHLQRLLQFQREEPPQAKLTKLQHALSHYRFPQADTLPLLAALLSLPQPEGCAPLTLSPQKQRQKTQEALVAWIMEETEKAAEYCAWEDLHWADPSTFEVLTLFLEQIPTTRVFAVLTFRPDFTPPWSPRSYLTPLTLSRLPRTQAEEMVIRITGGKALPTKVTQQIMTKTDGVPLFVEELTKMVVEAEADVGARHAVPLLLGIPSTLQDALMARLDRLGPTKEIAQLGATIGREFSYELLHAVSSVGDETLQHGLKQLMAVELVYQRGLPPQATYLFKHALVQDAAYQSLLKSKRQHYHQQIAQVLEEQFPETKETQPELLAHHYTEARLIGQAIPYWQQAGQRAVRRSANVEAISHLTKGLELLKTLSDTSAHTQQELLLQTTLGPALMSTKGFAAPEVEQAYTRARELCQQVEETPQLFPVLFGLWLFYTGRAEHQIARELAEQCLSLARRAQDSALLLQAHHAQWTTSFFLGEFALAREHAKQGMTLYDLQQHRSHAFLYGGHDPGVCGWGFEAWASWHLGYPAQALGRIHEALTLAQELSHPFSLAFVPHFAAISHQFRREGQAVQERAEALIALCSEQGFALLLAWGTIERGWALAEQGQGEAGLAQMRQGLVAQQATGTELYRPYFLTLLAEAYGKAGQIEEGLTLLAEALATVDKSGERFYEAELYRLKGELTLQQFKVQGAKCKVEEAEECFRRAIDVARRQQAKSLELRAVMSLAWLWQSQGKKEEARQMLAEIYGWFIEGFDTRDLQEAKTLLEELGH
jgi:predicted ATPase/class 3 adenylate cyclase